jgi:hypothetical protein
MSGMGLINTHLTVRFDIDREGTHVWGLQNSCEGLLKSNIKILA